MRCYRAPAKKSWGSGVSVWAARRNIMGAKELVFTHLVLLHRKLVTLATTNPRS